MLPNNDEEFTAGNLYVQVDRAFDFAEFIQIFYMYADEEGDAVRKKGERQWNKQIWDYGKDLPSVDAEHCVSIFVSKLANFVSAGSTFRTTHSGGPASTWCLKEQKGNDVLYYAIVMVRCGVCDLERTNFNQVIAANLFR